MISSSLTFMPCKGKGNGRISRSLPPLRDVLFINLHAPKGYQGARLRGSFLEIRYDGNDGASRLPGEGMTEDKRIENRRKKDRRTQERRDAERKFVFFDRLFKCLFASIVILVVVWVYIFTG